ncbi:MAG: rhodanese-like domain-containing protein [Roseiarcus sp.]
MTQAQDAPNSSPALPKAKQTSLGLYLTARQAYEKWKADPDRVKIIDVRTPEEYVYVGHAEMAWNIPVAVATYQWDNSGRDLQPIPNPDFLPRVKALFKPADTLLVMCRSGGRSALSVNLLAQAGFTQVHNIVDGMEGDLVKDPESLYHGKRLKNGWKNSNLPWTYDIDPKKMCLPSISVETRASQ